MKTNLLKTALTLIGIVCFSLAFAQNEKKEYQKDPKANERVIGSITDVITLDEETNNIYDMNRDRAYTTIFEKAKKEYPNKIVDIRNLDYSEEVSWRDRMAYRYVDKAGSICSPKVKNAEYKYVKIGYWRIHKHTIVAKVVEFISPETQLNETLVKAANKALGKVSAGSRFAIDQISVSGKLDKETVNDQIIDILLDKSYKVVAKEYLEKLKEELEEQQSGGFNERTMARTENFSGIGYFLNVRVNDKSIRIQVVNVSTGEYEGNATVEF